MELPCATEDGWVNTRTRTNLTSEHGIGMVELLVVLLIIAVVGSVALMSVRGARASGGRAEASAAASRYADAIDRYQQEHGRKLPMIGSPMWPSANEGPVHRLVMGTSAPIVRPYLRGGRAPDVMKKRGASGVTLVQATTRCPAISATGGMLVYRVGPAGSSTCGPALLSANQYSITVFWQGKLLCSVGDAVSVTKRC